MTRIAADAIARVLRAVDVKKLAVAAALAVSLDGLLTCNVAAQNVFTPGDVFIAVGSGSVQWRRPSGILVQTLVSGVDSNGFTTGMAFDSDDNLYVTMFSLGAVSVFNNGGVFTGTFGSGFNASPESIVFDQLGNVYVGQADGTGDILKFDANGAFLASFDVATEDRGSDWIDLAQNQCTMFYTSEGFQVKRFDVCTNTQLPDFATLPARPAFALRQLPTGGFLVADSQTIVRLDVLGNIVQQYDATGEDSWFALNLDPNGLTFWSADFTSANVYQFEIVSGSVIQTFNSGTGPGTVFGLTINGEITAGTQLPPPPEQVLPVTQPGFHSSCITRNSRYWFTHPDSDVPNCATLMNAALVSNGGFALGFMGLPQEFRNADNVKDAKDAVIEALGFNWKSQKRTGEANGTQSEKLPGSKLCRERKRLSVELIAAIGNNAFLGTAPENCTFTANGSVTHFPTNLIEQAGQANASDDVDLIKNMTTLLKQFNNSGVTNNFLGGRVECSPTPNKTLKTFARDPTNIVSCPGINEFCETAAAILHFPFNQTVDLTSYADSFGGPSCGAGGPNAVWQIAPPTAANTRNFTVDTFGSNFDTLLSVWSGTSCNALTEIACNDDAPNSAQSQLTFTTNGTDTFYIVGEGKRGTTGKLRIHVVSH